MPRLSPGFPRVLRSFTTDKYEHIQPFSEVFPRFFPHYSDDYFISYLL